MSPERKPYHVKIQREAIDDLERVYAFIADDAPVRARQFVRSLRKKIFSLKCFPHRGTRVGIFEEDSTLSEIRFIEHRGYLIFYTVHKKEIIILHITGPGQNWHQFIV